MHVCWHEGTSGICAVPAKLGADGPMRDRFPNPGRHVVAAHRKCSSVRRESIDGQKGVLRGAGAHRQVRGETACTGRASFARTRSTFENRESAALQRRTEVAEAASRFPSHCSQAPSSNWSVPSCRRSSCMENGGGGSPTAASPVLAVPCCRERRPMKRAFASVSGSSRCGMICRRPCVAAIPHPRRLVRGRQICDMPLSRRSDAVQDQLIDTGKWL